MKEVKKEETPFWSTRIETPVKIIQKNLNKQEVEDLATYNKGLVEQTIELLNKVGRNLTYIENDKQMFKHNDKEFNRLHMEFITALGKVEEANKLSAKLFNYYRRKEYDNNN